ncbi:hypothetical protein VCHA53O466_40364 [Vibrio chagasii]|nr:hypothetical protein VCHA53O466_40364 [Vibrio chagasii]
MLAPFMGAKILMIIMNEFMCGGRLVRHTKTGGIYQTFEPIEMIMFKGEPVCVTPYLRVIESETDDGTLTFFRPSDEFVGFEVLVPHIETHDDKLTVDDRDVSLHRSPFSSFKWQKVSHKLTGKVYTIRERRSRVKLDGKWHEVAILHDHLNKNVIVLVSILAKMFNKEPLDCSGD